MQVDVPIEAMEEVAKIIENEELQNNIVGSDDGEININLAYDDDQRGAVLEILEIIEEYRD